LALYLSRPFHRSKIIATSQHSNQFGKDECEHAADQAICHLTADIVTSRRSVPCPSTLLCSRIQKSPGRDDREPAAEREPAILAVLESVDARLETFYWMFGEHDGIAVVETAQRARANFREPGR
jgi:hypothetical protein